MIKYLMEQWYRKKTKQEILSLRRKLSFFYAFLGWNTFGIVFYLFMKKEIPEDPNERRATYGRLLASPSNMHVYQVSGLTVTNDFDIANKVTQIEKENSDSASAKTDEH